MKRYGELLLILAGFVAGITFVYSCGGGGSSGSAATIDQLEARIVDLETKLAYLSVDNSSTLNGLAPPHVIFNGANLHVQNGSGSSSSVNGVGNLIVGYNPANSDTVSSNRGGSHNLVVGRYHEYPSSNGFVAGRENKITARDSSVSGGGNNIASGSTSSISGGQENAASGTSASVSGGMYNEATGPYSSVSGGHLNLASGVASSVSGGGRNIASAYNASVSGGMLNEATHDPNIYGHTHVSGGQSNTASGEFATVSGGYNNVADQPEQLLP